MTIYHGNMFTLRYTGQQAESILCWVLRELKLNYKTLDKYAAIYCIDPFQKITPKYAYDLDIYNIIVYYYQFCDKLFPFFTYRRPFRKASDPGIDGGVHNNSSKLQLCAILKGEGAAICKNDNPSQCYSKR